MKGLFYTLSLYVLFSCSNSISSEIDFMEGVWKREGKQQFEVWEKMNDELFTGYAYTLVDDKKVISETLKIKWINKQWVFEATVPNQNQGKPIGFVLNADEEKLKSFENLTHDFPKKIQYENQSNNRIKVQVLGENGKGFSYIQIKQDKE